MNKIVLFGAGKIGRSFIGQLFSRGGYEVVFIDIDPELIDEMNRRKSYPVIIKEEDGDEELLIRNVRGVCSSSTDAVIREIADTSLVATAVGKSNLEEATRLIASGLRHKQTLDISPVTDIIIAENVRNAADVVRDILAEELNDREFIENNIGLVETSIGKMVPIMSRKETERDRLMVYAEAYNTLILDKKGFKKPIPLIAGLAPKENMKAWVDRKSFIHNLGHAAIAYSGHLKFPERKFLYELLEDKEISGLARSAMLQSAEALLKEYPGEFTRGSLTGHIDDLIKRFRNRSLADTAFRVGMDLFRKLGPEDRLIGAIKLARKHNLNFDKICYILACGFHFRATDESGKMFSADSEFNERYRLAPVEVVLNEVCGIDPVKENDILESVFKANNSLLTEKTIK